MPAIHTGAPKAKPIITHLGYALHNDSERKSQRFFLLILLLLLLIVSPVWLPGIGRFLVVSDPLDTADALVILAGDENERIAYGARLFRQGYAEWFVLTDMRLDGSKTPGSYSAIVKRKAIRQGVPEEQILIADRVVATTYEEAMGIRSLTALHGFRSLIVVTSPYHARRARWILNEVFDGSGVTLNVHPVNNHSFHPDVWWQSAENRRFTATEYLKMMAHLAGFRSYDQYGPWLQRWLEALSGRLHPSESQSNETSRESHA